MADESKKVKQKRIDSYFEQVDMIKNYNNKFIDEESREYNPDWIELKRNIFIDYGDVIQYLLNKKQEKIKKIFASEIQKEHDEIFNFIKIINFIKLIHIH